MLYSKNILFEKNEKYALYSKQKKIIYSSLIKLMMMILFQIYKIKWIIHVYIYVFQVLKIHTGDNQCLWTFDILPWKSDNGKEKISAKVKLIRAEGKFHVESFSLTCYTCGRWKSDISWSCSFPFRCVCISEEGFLFRIIFCKVFL